MHSNSEIEAIGMQESMRYEREQGRIPEDVATQNLGFDIRSTGKDGRKYYIEVKARSETGPVALTQNEWFKARRFQDDYYLHVVLNAASTPELHCIPNPAAVLTPTEQYEVRYLVSLSDILKRSTARDLPPEDQSSG